MSLGGFVAPEGRTDDSIASIATHERRKRARGPANPECRFPNDGITPGPVNRTRTAAVPRTTKGPPPEGRPFDVNPGGDLLSQAVAHQVPSARRGLTTLFGMGRGVSLSPWPPESSRDRVRTRPGRSPGTRADAPSTRRAPSKLHSGSGVLELIRPRGISTSLLHALLRFHISPINLVVFQDPYSLEGMGGLISEWASRLDAFSGYPVRA